MGKAWKLFERRALYWLGFTDLLQNRVGVKADCSVNLSSKCGGLKVWLYYMLQSCYFVTLGMHRIVRCGPCIGEILWLLRKRKRKPLRRRPPRSVPRPLLRRSRPRRRSSSRPSEFYSDDSGAALHRPRSEQPRQRYVKPTMPIVGLFLPGVWGGEIASASLTPILIFPTYNCRHSREGGNPGLRCAASAMIFRRPELSPWIPAFAGMTKKRKRTEPCVTRAST